MAIKAKKSQAKLDVESTLLYGKEPDLAGVHYNQDTYKEIVKGALYWANYCLDPRSLKLETLTFLDGKHPQITRLEQAKDYRFTSIGKYAWLINKGVTLEPKTHEWLVTNINKIGDTLQNDATELDDDGNLVEIVSNVVSKADVKELRKLRDVEKRRELVDEVIGSIDSAIDEAVLSTEKKPVVNRVAVYDALESLGDDKKAAEVVKEYFQGYNKRLADESYDAKNVDPEMFDGASGKKAYLDNIDRHLKVIRDVFQEIMKCVANVKGQKKHKETKIFHQPSKQVKKVKLNSGDNEYKLQSIDPASIVCAQMVVAFNVKNRKVIVYRAKDHLGLSVKGTTLLNLNEDTSTSKTLRKPNEQINAFRNGDQKRIEKAYSNVKAKARPVNGRLSKNIVLLGAFRD